jgi:hypothetical protein
MVNMINILDFPRNMTEVDRCEMYDTIYDFESSTRDLDDPDASDYFRHNQYYLGIPFYDEQYNSLLLASTVHNKTFFQYNIDNIIYYLNNFSILRQDHLVNPEIMKLQICDDSYVYSVVIKTFWIRLIQRVWKKIYKEKRMIVQNGLIPYLKNRELTDSQIRLPSLHGMMNHLKSV